MAVEIKNVDEGSLAQEAGIVVGDLLVEINGHTINDVLDYGFYSASKEVTVLVRSGEILKEIDIIKGEYEDIGLDFADFLMDDEHECDNDCIFCFVDQLPRGLRGSLYFKDDDERLSYLFGNYLTLTNLYEGELERIIEMRITPINISVHTTDPALRCMMLRNDKAGELLDYMKKLAAADIQMNCQIVVCRGINDGDALKRTIDDLAALYPAVQSVAVVPVGLTKYRDGLFPLEAHNAASAAEVLDIVGAYAARFRKKYGTGFVYGSDEWYLLSGREFPDIAEYDELVQYENGVGMIPALIDDFSRALDDAAADGRTVKTDIVCGAAPAGAIRELAKLVKTKFPNVECRVHPVENDFFGRGITVSGLVTATDIAAQIRAQDLIGDRIYFAKSMLRSENDMFLDSVTVEALEQKLGVAAVPCDYDGEALFEVMTGEYIDG